MFSHGVGPYDHHRPAFKRTENEFGDSEADSPCKRGSGVELWFETTVVTFHLTRKTSGFETNLSK